jgi:hypothetical protein
MGRGTIEVMIRCSLNGTRWEVPKGRHHAMVQRLQQMAGKVTNPGGPLSLNGIFFWYERWVWSNDFGFSPLCFEIIRQFMLARKIDTQLAMNYEENLEVN